MRLDKLLVIKGYFSSRQKAKEAIKRGFVIVNGEVITKPSTEVDLSANIVVLTSEKPRGYWKLKELDEAWNFIKEGDKVLDLGSSAGGFLLYASEKVGEDGIVYGIEISREFESDLREIEKSRKNVKIFIEDVFKFDISKLEPLDVILNDLTLDPISSFKATLRFMPLLKKGARVLFVMKTGGNYQEPDFYGFEIVNVKDAEDRKERYILLERK
ncbi:MAG TPA: methyltransferase domain-containing protein [Archaeoglobus profundus]|nr:methyltransferase domain-containing protein [Archaeoglobus profundus]